jgi:predicted ATPase
MEQLLVSSPPILLQKILTQAPGVKILATSRAPLNVQGEQLYRVSGLTLPLNQTQPSLVNSGEWARQYDAVRLFESSALRVCPDFRLEEGNIDPVLAIGRYVEGFPLGLEMAAAWVELLSPVEIEKELSESFDLLEAEWTPAADRHHSARAVFEWSWRLLSKKEQNFCQALSLFRGGFSREAALAVGQASLPTLLNLKRKSWLQQSGDDRYHIHELLRQYAEEKLHEDEEALRLSTAGYARYFVTYFERLAEAAHGPQQQEALEAIEQDFDNARIVWQWLVDQRRYTDVTNSLLPALFIYATATSRFPEIGSLIKTARDRLAHEYAREEFQTAKMTFYAVECKLEYDYLGGDVFGEVTVPSDILHEGWNIMIQEPAGFIAGPWAVLISTFYGWQQDRAQGLQWLRRLANDYCDRDDRWLYAFSLQALGQLLIMRATQQILAADASKLATEKEEAFHRFEQALNLFVELGDKIEQSRTLRWLGHLVQGEDPGMALDYFQEANSLLEGTNIPAIHYYAYLAFCYLSLGDDEEAFRIFAQARRHYERQGNRTLLSGVLSLESMQAARFGDIDHARDLREAGLRIYQELGYDVIVIYSFYELGEIDRIAGLIESARRYYEQALSLFKTLGDPDSHGQAFCQRGLGDLALLNGDYTLARRYFESAITLAKEPFVHSWLTSQAKIRLVQTAIHLGDIKAAEEYLDQVDRLLTFRGIVDNSSLLMLALAEIAALMVAKNETDHALALGTFVANHPASWHETRWRAEEIMATAVAKLSPSARRAAETQGRQMTLDDALALAGWK